MQRDKCEVNKLWLANKIWIAAIVRSWPVALVHMIKTSKTAFLYTDLLAKHHQLWSQFTDVSLWIRSHFLFNCHKEDSNLYLKHFLCCLISFHVHFKAKQEISCHFLNYLQLTLYWKEKFASDHSSGLKGLRRQCIFTSVQNVSEEFFAYM